MAGKPGNAPADNPSPEAVVVIGPSGSGKSTIAERLATRLGCRFMEADSFHPAGNIRKMTAGEALNDDDRTPWLSALADAMSQRMAEGEKVVLACSALKKRYRNRLRQADGPITFVMLVADEQTIRDRLSARHGHFMPASLLDSQFADFEPLEPDENGISVPNDQTPEAVVDQIISALATSAR